MKMFITAHYGSDDESETRKLREAVKSAGFEDFCFAQDIKQTFRNQADLWEMALEKVASCDALLIDVSDNPSGGRVIEVGIAYALKKPIFVIAKTGTAYKPMYDGLASKVITYDNYDAVTKSLSDYTEGSPMKTSHTRIR